MLYTHFSLSRCVATYQLVGDQSGCNFRLRSPTLNDINAQDEDRLKISSKLVISMFIWSN